MKINDISKLAIAITISESAGIIGSVFTISSIPTWYAGLTKPEFAPPNWVFGPIWATLFALMGIAAFLVWKEEGIAASPSTPRNDKRIKIALGVFMIQLVLNTFWSIIFFGLHNSGAAFVEIIFLWFAILATIITFIKVSKMAAWLLTPYLFWVSFAAYLNYAIWILN